VHLQLQGKAALLHTNWHYIIPEWNLFHAYEIKYIICFLMKNGTSETILSFGTKDILRSKSFNYKIINRIQLSRTNGTFTVGISIV